MEVEKKLRHFVPQVKKTFNIFPKIKSKNTPNPMAPEYREELHKKLLASTAFTVGSIDEFLSTF